MVPLRFYTKNRNNRICQQGESIEILGRTGTGVEVWRRLWEISVEILDDEIKSRYDKIHGKDGLCSALMEIFNVMAELRLKAEYGDYLAYTCTALKGEGRGERYALENQEAGLASGRDSDKSRREGASRQDIPSPRPYPNALP